MFPLELRNERLWDVANCSMIPVRLGQSCRLMSSSNRAAGDIVERPSLKRLWHDRSLLMMGTAKTAIDAAIAMTGTNRPAVIRPDAALASPASPARSDPDHVNASQATRPPEAPKPPAAATKARYS